MQYKQAVRKTVVTRVRIDHVKAGDPFFPKWALDDRPDLAEIWWVRFSTRSGLLPEQTAHLLLTSKEEAERFASRHPVGSPFDFDSVPGYEAKRQQHVREKIDAKLGPAAAAGESSLAVDVLEKAGITVGFVDLSPAVLTVLGKQRIGELKRRFGENWSAAAEFEYCCLTLPSSSPAYVAAAYQFHYFITHDDFAAGYLWRDLECLVHGVEAAAVKAIEMRKSAGERGGRKAGAARVRRRTSLMDAIEVVVNRNPDITKLGIKAVTDLALHDCVESDPGLWSQGRGQAEEYIGELRRGEAGSELQARLTHLFPENRLSAFPNS